MSRSGRISTFLDELKCSLNDSFLFPRNIPKPNVTRCKRPATIRADSLISQIRINQIQVLDSAKLPQDLRKLRSTPVVEVPERDRKPFDSRAICLWDTI